MAAILQTTVSNAFLENLHILIQISVKFLPRVPNNNNADLVQITRLGTEQATSHYLNK